MAAQRIFDKKRGVLNTVGLISATFDIAVPTGVTIGFNAKIVIKETTLFIGAFNSQVGSISNNAGIVTLDAVNVTLGSVINAALAGITTIFTANGTNLRITVTGLPTLNIDWQYEIEVIQN